MTQTKEAVRTLLRAVTAVRIFRTPLQELSQTGLLPASVWRRLPVEATFRVSLPDGRSFRYSAAARDTIGRALFWRGLKSWESETLGVFYKLARHSTLTLDIGANTGVYSLLACTARPDAKVISFEPVPHIYKRLVEHITMNGWSDRCQAHSQAVSNGVGVAQFHVPFGDVPSSASLDTQGFRNYKGTLIDVAMTTVDECLQGARVDLVKIDVEGFEDKVLDGMRQTLASSAPTIIVEANPDGPFEAVDAILAAHGYHFFHLRKSGPAAIERIIPDERSEERNFLCVARDNQELFV